MQYCICYYRYYFGNDDVKNDKEFKRFLNELSLDGSRLFNGGIGRVSIESRILINCCCSFVVFLSSFYSLKSTDIFRTWLLNH